MSFDRDLRREWLETNGVGGFASGTVSGANTRRYHGLLVAATRPPLGRLVLLSKLEETIYINGWRHDFSTNQYPGVIHPNGYRFLREFDARPFPAFHFEFDGFVLEKRIFLVHGENTVVVEYELRSPAQDCVLELRPLVAFREYHSTTHANDAINAAVEVSDGVAAIRPYEGLPPLYFAHNGESVERTGAWYYNLEYALERERGLDYQEDLFNPFRLRFNLAQRRTATVVASLEPRDVADAAAMRERERSRRRSIAASSRSRDPLVEALTVAADQYIVQRGEGKTILAGYHWFEDWGRDTMIALPGLTLATGRYEVAREILEAYAGRVDGGMIPNRFSEAGESPDYNTVDATLWMFEAARAYLEHSGDELFVRDRMYAVLQDVVEHHVRGTRYGIRVDADGLLACGEAGVQLTWMDAKVGDWVVTPRSGKPVEIAALWYNALRTMAEFGERFGDLAGAARYAEMAARAAASFGEKFWNAAAGCLYDVVDEVDASIRPNQVLAVSLRHSMLSEEQARQVVETVRRELLTPMGLRTLSPADARYRGRYAGGLVERDGAYHMGTVWPWLMGPFLSAYLRVNGGSREARMQAGEWLAELRRHLDEAGLGHVSEIADGDAPHAPRGCIAQAWSVAELLRVALELRL